MPVVINGTTGISGVDGTAASPAIEGGDTNTGMFFPAADTIAFAEGGTEVLRINSSSQVEFQAGTSSLPTVTASGDLNTGMFFPAADTVAISTGGSEEFRIGPLGQIGLSGANYGTSGQTIISGGSGAGASWGSAGAWVLIGNYTPTNVATLDVTNLSAYSAIRVTFSNLRPATDNVVLWARISSDNGSSYISTSTYNHVVQTALQNATPALSTTGQTGAAVFVVSAGGTAIGNAAGDGGVGGQLLFTDFNTAQKTKLQTQTTLGDTGGLMRSSNVNASQNAQTAMNAFRLLFSSGNISTGLVCVEGLV